jgi:hypothetical protein
LVSQLLNGYQGIADKVPLPISVGETVAAAISDANYQNAVGTAFNSRINAGVFANPGWTALSHGLGDPRMIEVPVMSFNPLNLLGKSVPVARFAQLWITTGSWNGERHHHRDAWSMGGIE